jgi:hypothetical protein
LTGGEEHTANVVARLAEIRHKNSLSARKSAYCSRVVAMSAISASAATTKNATFIVCSFLVLRIPYSEFWAAATNGAIGFCL